MSYPNGQFPASALAAIGNGYYLAFEPAAAFNAMSAEAQRRWGRPISVIAAYRTLAKQQYLYNGWIHRLAGFNLAAVPGTSNHGLGEAIDCASQWDRWAVDQIGAAFGWAKSWSDAPSEWWHIKYQSGHWNGHATAVLEPTLRRGAHNPAKPVKRLRHYLRRAGYRVQATGRFGANLQRVVKRYQRERGLTADGVVGAHTWQALHHTVPTITPHTKQHGDARKGLKRLLRGAGYPATLTASIGAKAWRSIKSFKAKVGLRRTAKVGPVMWRALRRHHKKK